VLGERRRRFDRVGATIHTVDEAYSSPEAFAVRDDLRGQTVLRGVIDAHLLS
jgi:hypothetical protein